MHTVAGIQREVIGRSSKAGMTYWYGFRSPEGYVPILLYTVKGGATPQLMTAGLSFVRNTRDGRVLLFSEGLQEPC